MSSIVRVDSPPFGTGMEWVLLMGVIIIIALLVWMLIEARKASMELARAEKTAAESSAKINQFVAKAEPIFDYAIGYICKSYPTLPFCGTPVGL